MSTVIYYFSATGNSLKVARDLAEQLDDTKIISITDKESTELDSEVDKVGLVFPVYIWGVPLIVDEFLQKIYNKIDNKYVFAVITCKSSPGAVLQQLQNKFKKHERKLSAGFTAYMPGNNIIGYQPDSDAVQQTKFDNWDKAVTNITSYIQNSITCEIERKSVLKLFLLTNLLNSIITKSFPNADKHYCVESNCTGCGVCSKVCPMRNIEIVDSKPVWKHKCQLCLACINLCPKKAIQYSKNTLGRQRYKNPFVELSLLQRKD